VRDAVETLSGPAPPRSFVRGLGVWDATAIVAGSMIGSGIFIVSADVARQVGAPGWLLVVWLLTGLALTVERLYRLRYLHRGPHPLRTAIGLLLLLQLSLGMSVPAVTDSS